MQFSNIIFSPLKSISSLRFFLFLEGDELMNVCADVEGDACGCVCSCDFVSRKRMLHAERIRKAFLGIH